MSAAAERLATWRRSVPIVAARCAVAVIAGAVLFASFPPRDLWWLAPVAIAGLGWCLHGRRVRAGFGYGLLFGLTFYLLHLLWIDDFLGADFGPAPWLALSGLMAVFAGLAAAAMTVVARLPGGPVWMAALFVAQETLRATIPLNGFPWGRLAFSQPDGAFTALASVGGAVAVTFAVALCGFGLTRVVVAATQRRWRGCLVPTAYALAPLLLGLAIWPTIDTGTTGATMTAAVVQGNAPNAGIDLLGARDEIRRNHLAESARLAGRIDAGDVPQPDVVVWSETATDVSGEDPEIDAVVSEFGVPALIGALYTDPAGNTENSVIAWDPRSGQGQRYAKRELVPFSEYVPWRTIAGWFTPFLDNTGDMRPGTEPGVLDVGGHRIGLAICYEAAYDYAARDAVREGAELLVVPTNNAWFGDGEMTYQHLAMSRLRAVEHGRDTVVAATSGVSAIVRADGTVVQRTGTYTADSLVSPVALRDSRTLATALGAWPERLIVGAGVAALLLGIGCRLRYRYRGRGTGGSDDRAAASTTGGIR